MNKKKLKVIAFIEALNAFHTDFRETQKYFKDQRLTQAEKKILECWLLLRDGRFDDILAILPKLSVDYDELVGSQKNLIWGITLNNRNDYDQALPYIQKSLEKIQSYHLPRLEFNVVNNLFVVYLNLKHEAGMKDTLERLLKIPVENHLQIICCLNCRFSYHAFKGEMNQAGKFLDELEEMSSSMSEIQIITHQINKYMFCAKLENFDGCESALKAMKKNRKFQSSANYIYMRSMLEHLKKNKPLYIYKKDFNGHPFLYFQLKVIQSFESSDLNEALKYWNFLMALAPHTYKEKYEYCGDKSVFSLALDKYVHKIMEPSKVIIASGNKEEVLLSFLKNSTMPVRKEVLYEKIWGEPLLDKADGKKLQKLVSRVRQKMGIEIQFKKECYELLASKKAA